ncbi:hypothetical protein BDK51DRAFT_44484 [Blyttiomyces helicus]|uniref:Uncharacterized protein n=1 Tax=Blyttiomyces helicus TaxID=388810 RepID=A0A4P9W283_9FUNG|nr:hypothetical protein BDK51DRAFT_44484 [Blyttiomyces helicus]|eukprot:RKO85842.1 hypothetical protein BDK51DRAFT_44484 [Blyttiomyces helicus]
MVKSQNHFSPDYDQTSSCFTIDNFKTIPMVSTGTFLPFTPAGPFALTSSSRYSSSSISSSKTTLVMGGVAANHSPTIAAPLMSMNPWWMPASRVASPKPSHSYPTRLRVQPCADSYSLCGTFPEATTRLLKIPFEPVSFDLWMVNLSGELCGYKTFLVHDPKELCMPPGFDTGFSRLVRSLYDVRSLAVTPGIHVCLYVFMIGLSFCRASAYLLLNFLEAPECRIPFTFYVNDLLIATQWELIARGGDLAAG